MATKLGLIFLIICACSLLGAKQIVSNQNSESNNFKCDICETAVGKLIQYMNKDNTEKQIVQFFNGLCAAIGGDTQQECKKLTKLVPLLIKYASKKFNPEQLCKLGQLCSTGDIEDQIDLQQLLGSDAIRSILASDQIGNILAPGLVSDVKQPAKTLAGSANSLECIVCSVVVDEVERYLKNKNTEQNIISFVDQLCKYLPGDSSKKCEKYVKLFGPVVLQALLQTLPANKVCGSYLNFCPKSSLDSHEVSVPAQHVSGPCVFCEAGVMYIDGLLRINQTKTDIYNALVKLCSAVPYGMLQADCDNFVEKHGTAAIRMITSGIAPLEVCKEFDLCQKSEMALHKLDVCRFGYKFWCGSKTAALYCKKQRQCGQF